MHRLRGWDAAVLPDADRQQLAEKRQVSYVTAVSFPRKTHTCVLLYNKDTQQK